VRDSDRRRHMDELPNILLALAAIFVPLLLVWVLINR
jgi:hypothetical protein